MQRLRRFSTRFRSNDKLLEYLIQNNPRRALRALDRLKERRCLQDGTLQGLKLNGARLNTATFARARLEGVRFSQASLRDTYFYEAQLQGADFSFADLRGANFRAAILTDANLMQAIAYGANFARADLSGADLSDCDLSQANFWQTNLTGACLEGVLTDGTRFVDVLCDETTILPDGAAWSPDVDWARFADG